MKKIDLTGKVFGRLTVVEEAAQMHGRPAWLCRCICGVDKVVAGGHLRSGATTSCGCYNVENTGNVHRTHGMTKSREYKSWAGMWARCTNPKEMGYKNYGGRGITVCPEWKDFTVFYKDLGPCPANYSIERVNNDEGYSASNCVWADKRTQNANTRAVKNSATGVCGVWKGRGTRYKAYIKDNRRITRYVGSFSTPEEAAAARKEVEQFFRTSRSLSDNSTT